MPTEPTLYVEVAFTTGASTGTSLHLDDPTRGKLNTGTLGDGSVDVPVWTNLASYFDDGELVISRSASRVDSPLIEYQTGTCTVPLTDTDRRFDPNNLSGPYVSGGVTQVTARRACRIRAQWAGITYDLFRGTTDNWDGEWHDPGYSTVTMLASDGFKILAGIDRTAVAAVGAGETTGARVTRILDGAGWAAADRSISTGDSTVQSTTLDGDVLAELQLVADTEIGELYVDGAGRIVFRNRNGILQDTRSNTSQATFGDSGSELPYEDLGQSTDDSTFFNHVRVTRLGGTEQVVEDGTSQALYYKKTYPAPTDPILQTDADALNYARWLLHVSSAPEVRFTSITVEAMVDGASLFPHTLGRELGDRITVIRRPPGGGSAIQADMFIRGIEHRIRQGSWRTTWTLQQASKYSSFLTLDNSTLGVLDSNALAY